MQPKSANNPAVPRAPASALTKLLVSLGAAIAGGTAAALGNVNIPIAARGMPSSRGDLPPPVR